MYQDEFLDNLGTWTNENQTISDPFLNQFGKVSMNSYYNPIKTIRTNAVLNQHTFISTPPGYMPCKIDLYYEGAYYKTIPILFPESISENLSTNFAKESPVGSTYPIVAFSSSQPSTIPISFIALADYLPTGYPTLKSYINDIKLLCKPRYAGDFVQSPSVKITYSDIVFYGVCDSIDIQYDSIYGNNSLVKANISCSFTVTGGV
mgnify:CR=1 FL=1